MIKPSLRRVRVVKLSSSSDESIWSVNVGRHWHTSYSVDKRICACCSLWKVLGRVWSSCAGGAGLRVHPVSSVRTPKKKKPHRQHTSWYSCEEIVLQKALMPQLVYICGSVLCAAERPHSCPPVSVSPGALSSLTEEEEANGHSWPLRAFRTHATQTCQKVLHVLCKGEELLFSSSCIDHPVNVSLLKINAMTLVLVLLRS